MHCAMQVLRERGVHSLQLLEKLVSDQVAKEGLRPLDKYVLEDFRVRDMQISLPLPIQSRLESLQTSGHSATQMWVRPLPSHGIAPS